MKIFRFVKKSLFTGLTILSSFTNTNPLSASKLSWISINNQVCKARPEIINVNNNILYFILLVLKQVNAVVIVIILMVHMQKFVFLML